VNADANGENVYADGVLMVTKREAARRLSMSQKTLDRARRRGDLGAKRLGNKIWFLTDELRRFAESLPADEG
jgi:hypothetical protein